MAAAVEHRFSPQTGALDAEFERLFKEHHDRVLRAAYRITGSMAEAEDVAQTVFMRVAQAGNSIPIANEKSYLYRAAINAALDVVRRRQRENAVPLDVVSDEHGTRPSDDALDAKRCLRSALARVDARSAEMFAMRYLEECDLAEIAQAFNTSRAVVAVTLHRTRTRLRKELRTMRGTR